MKFWIKKTKQNSELIWNSIPNYIFIKIGNLQLQLVTDFNIHKLPINYRSSINKGYYTGKCSIYIMIRYTPPPYGVTDSYNITKDHYFTKIGWRRTFVHLMDANGYILKFAWSINSIPPPPKVEFTRLLKSLLKQFTNRTQNTILTPQLATLLIIFHLLTKK